MKKIFKKFAVLLVFCVISIHVNANTTNTTNWDSAASLAKVNTIGTKLLTANKLPAKITFKVSSEDHVNAYATANNEIYVYKGLLQYVENDDELAAVIAHEIGHIVNAHCAKQSLIGTALAYAPSQISNEKAATAANVATQLTSLKMSRNAEYEADLSATDLLKGAGYNPLSLVSVLNKICENYTDFTSTHPSGDKRTLNIYDYVSYNYPIYITKGYSTNSYKSFAEYVKPTVEKRQTNTKEKEKFEKQQAKLKKEKEKREITMKKESNPWSASFNVINALTAN